MPATLTHQAAAVVNDTPLALDDHFPIAMLGDSRDPNNWTNNLTSNVDDDGGVVQFQCDALRLTLALGDIDALIPESRDYDNVIRQNCEVLRGYPGLEEACWPFPMRSFIDLTTTMELEQAHCHIVVALEVAQRLLTHLEDELQQGTPPGPNPPPMADEAQQERR
jgi:hypothetical protein